MWRTSWVLIVCFSSLVLFAAADSGSKAEQVPRHPLTNMPEPGSISTSYYFPTYSNKQFPAGDLAKVVLGIHNDGSDMYNISMIMGSLNAVTDFSVHYQNFSQEFYLKTVDPGQEISVEYTFRPDPALPPRDFIVALTVFYSTVEQKWHSTTFFNQTITIVETKKLVDTDLICMILTLVGIVLAIGYVFSESAVAAIQKVGLMKKGKGRPKGKKAEVVKADDSEDWVKGTPYDNFRKKQASGTSQIKTAKAS